MKLYLSAGCLNKFHSQFPILSCSDNYFTAVKLFIISITVEKMALPGFEPATIELY